MPVVVGLLIVALIGYLAYRAFLARTASPQVASVARSERGFAFISNGLLFFRERGGKVQQLHSPYAQEALDRRERSRERHGWKQGTTFQIAAGRGMRDFEAPDKPMHATSAAFEANGDLLYFLKDDHMGGLFRREAASGKELRLLVKPNLHLGDLRLSPDGSMLVVSSQQTGGVANIAMMKSDGSGYGELTSGDTVDSAPAWIPGASRRLLFQSAGLARNEQGYVVAQGSASIQKVDLDSGKVEPILESPDFDYLKPRVTAGGELLFIRRPYEAARYGAGAVLTDILLFPFRVLRAVFHWLNFFSLMYSRKPLTSASGPAMQADLKDILLQGRRIDAEKARRSARPVHGVPSLVPETWVLVSRSQAGVERVLATNVASYDVSADGTVVYSNGRGVFVLADDGSTSLAVTEDLVGEVVA
jgi:hypothetical protein